MASAGMFSAELSVYNLHREAWMRSHPDRFVAIQDDVIADGFYDTYSEALKAGIQRFGVRKNFLVKQVRTHEQVYVVS